MSAFYLQKRKDSEEKMRYKRIELDNYRSMLRVFLNGSKVTGGKVSVLFNWKTKDEDNPKTVPSFQEVYAEEGDGPAVEKAISFKDPFYK